MISTYFHKIVNWETNRIHLEELGSNRKIEPSNTTYFCTDGSNYNSIYWIIVCMSERDLSQIENFC